MLAQVIPSLPKLKCTSGGLSETEEIAFAVVPYDSPSAVWVVTTLTPVGNLPHARLNSSSLGVKILLQLRHERLVAALGLRIVATRVTR